MVNNSTSINITNNYLTPQITEHKFNAMTYVDGNLGPDLGQTQKCSRVKLVNVMPTPLM